MESKYKIVFDKNGTGKTMYSKSQNNDFTFDSSIENWAEYSGDKITVSQYGKEKKLIEEKNLALEKKLLSAKSSLLDKMPNLKIGTLKIFYKDLGFNKIKSWIDFESSDIPPMVQLKGSPEMLEIIRNNKEDIEKVLYDENKQTFDSIILLSEMNKMNIDEWEDVSEGGRQVLNSLKQLKQGLQEFLIKAEVNKKIRSLTREQLLKIRESDLDSANDSTVLFLKFAILNSPEFDEIFKNVNKIKKLDKEGFEFDKDKIDSFWNISDDLKTISTSKKMSSGERTINISKAILKSMKPKTTSNSIKGAQ